MEKISLQKKSFFNSIGLDVNNIPAELKIKSTSMQNSLPKEDMEFFGNDGMIVQGQKYFRLRNLVGTNKSAYNNKSWLEIFVNNDKSDEIIKQYFKNPNYYFRDLRKIDPMENHREGNIELCEDNGKMYVVDGVGRLSLMMVKYLLEMSRASSKEERALINKQYIFSANVKSIPKDRDIIYLVKMLENIYGSKLKVSRDNPSDEYNLVLTYGEKVMHLKTKEDLENFIKNSYLPKEHKSQEKLKNRITNLTKIGLEFKEDTDNDEIFLVMGKIFPNYEIFIKYYKKMLSYKIEDKFYSLINLSDVTYEYILKLLINLIKQEESDMKKKVEKKKNVSITAKEKISEEVKSKGVKNANKPAEKKVPNEKAAVKLTEKKVSSEKAVAKLAEKKVINTKDLDAVKKKVKDSVELINNSMEMMYYKFKTEESKMFELANQSTIILNIDRINDDTVNSSISSIKSVFLELENAISDEKDENKLKNISDFVKGIKKSHLNENIISEYKEEMLRIYSACLNKHVQRIITDSKLQKLDIQREEIEKEKCSFFSKIIGKAKLKQAKLDNINLKRQLILSESQYADKLHYYIEDGLSDLYAYIKNEDEVKCLVEAREFTRLIETNMQIQNYIDGAKLNRQIKEKVEQKRNLPQLALSKEKRRLFSKAQINLMEEKNNELKRVIQITRANSLKQQNTGLVPILGNIKTTKAFHKFCGDLNKIESEVRSLI